MLQMAVMSYMAVVLTLMQVLNVAAQPLIPDQSVGANDASSVMRAEIGKEGDVDVTKLVVGAVATSAMKMKHPYYHTSKELTAEVQRLAGSCRGFLTTESIKDESDPSVYLDVIRVKNPEMTPKHKMAFLFGEHSRELISPESGLHMLKALCGETETHSLLQVDDVLKNSEFMVVLNGNPRSRQKVEGGDFCLRTNPEGVDLNRNYDEAWQGGAGEGDTNPGSQPFSEPETRILKQVMTDYQPTSFLTVHSGTYGMYMPYAYDSTHLAKRNGPEMLEMLKTLDEEHCKCPYGAAGKEVGYDCPGTSLDWVFDKLKTPYAFAWEIYVSDSETPDLSRRWDESVRSGGVSLLEGGEHLAHKHFSDLFAKHSSDFVQQRGEERVTTGQSADSCFSNFNPGTKEEYDANVANWAKAYLDLANLVAAKL